MFKLACVAVAFGLTGVPVADAKPTAPVVVYLHARPVAAGVEVTLVAVPTRDLPALELDLGTAHTKLGATARGRARSLTATFAVKDGEGLDVVGSATTRDGKRFRNAPALIRIGTPAPVEKPTGTLRTLPNGTVIDEVR